MRNLSFSAIGLVAPVVSDDKRKIHETSKMLPHNLLIYFQISISESHLHFNRG